MSNEQRIWTFLYEKIGNAFGVAGLMGNLYAESGLNPKNLQNSYEKSLGMTDESYTAAVDSGSYTAFADDSAGYGLAQWTFSTRKAALLAYVKGQEKSVGVLDGQIGYHEKAINASLESMTANAGHNNWTKYANDFDTKYPNWYNGKKNGFAWCDMFVDWCFLTAFGYENALRLLCQPEKSAGAGCIYSLKYYQSKGQFHKTDPLPGDQIFFGVSAATAEHTGIVEYVEGGSVHTIEGNTCDMVARRTYSLSYARIIGYGRPAYDEEAGAKTVATPEPVVTNAASLKIGDTVTFTGSKQYVSPYTGARQVSAKPSKAKVTAISTGKAHPYHLIGDGIYGWAEAADIEGLNAVEIKVGDIVKMNGTTHYTRSYAGAAGYRCKGGEAKVTYINRNGAHPYCLAHTGEGCTVMGWVDAADVSR